MTDDVTRDLARHAGQQASDAMTRSAALIASGAEEDFAYSFLLFVVGAVGAYIAFTRGESVEGLRDPVGRTSLCREIVHELLGIVS